MQNISAREYSSVAEDVEIKDMLFVAESSTLDIPGYLYVSDLNFGLYCFALERDYDESSEERKYALRYRFSIPLAGKVSSITWYRDHLMIIVATLIPVKVYMFEMYGNGVLH